MQNCHARRANHHRDIGAQSPPQKNTTFSVLSLSLSVCHMDLGHQEAARCTATRLTPEGILGYGTCAQAANSTKRRKKMGSSVAYKTIGTFQSQSMGHDDASGRATDRLPPPSPVRVQHQSSKT